MGIDICILNNCQCEEINKRSAINKNPSKQKSERCLSREGEENVCEKEIHFG